MRPDISVSSLDIGSSGDRRLRLGEGPALHSELERPFGVGKSYMYGGWERLPFFFFRKSFENVKRQGNVGHVGSDWAGASFPKT